MRAGPDNIGKGNSLWIFWHYCVVRTLAKGRAAAVSAAWALIALTVLVPFFFSSQTAQQSNAFSGEVASGLSGLLDSLIRHIRETEPEVLSDQIHTLVRKAGHFCMYAALTVLLHIAISILLSRRMRYRMPILFLLTFAGISAAAALDELHQYFVPGRSMEFTDIIIDVSGALFALLITGAFRLAGWLAVEYHKRVSAGPPAQNNTEAP